MKKRLKQVITAVMGTMLVLSMTACGSVKNGNTDSKNKTIRIGSKDFTENLVVSEVYSLAL